MNARLKHIARAIFGEPENVQTADPKLRLALDKRALERALRDAGVSKSQATRAAAAFFNENERGVK